MDLNQLLYDHQIALIKVDEARCDSALHHAALHHADRLRQFRKEMGVTQYRAPTPTAPRCAAGGQS